MEKNHRRKRKRPLTGTVLKKNRKLKEKRPPFIISFSDCGFCKDGKDESDNLRGTFFQDETENVAAHQFCMLFSSGLPQAGSDNDGFEGFLFQDIKKEMRRGSKIQCMFCLNYGASSGCAVKSCCRTYHYKCGLENDIQFDFYGTFNTYCSTHRSHQDMSCILNGSRIPLCPICLDEIESSTSILKMPCCRNVFAHKSCIQLQAYSSGYFFKCPTCKNEKEFKREMARYGIYIPLRDATWEEDNAYSDLLQQYKNCDDPSCKCPMGRDYEEEHGEWELLRCYHCGQGAVHLSCLGKRYIPKYKYVCRDCNDATGVLKQSTFLAGNCEKQTLGQKKMIEDRLANGDQLVRKSLLDRFNIKPCQVELKILPSWLTVLKMAKGDTLSSETVTESSESFIESTVLKPGLNKKCSISMILSPVLGPEKFAARYSYNDTTEGISTSSDSCVQILCSPKTGTLPSAHEPETPRTRFLYNEEITHLVTTSSPETADVVQTKQTKTNQCSLLKRTKNFEEPTDAIRKSLLRGSSLSLSSTSDAVLTRSPESLYGDIKTHSVCLPSDTHLAYLPKEAQSACLHTETHSSCLPIKMHSAHLPTEPHSACLPTDTLSTSLPIDTHSTGSPIDTHLACLPIETSSTCLPMDPDSVCLPVDTDLACSPIDTDSADLPIDTDSACLPTDTDSACLPIDTDSACSASLSSFNTMNMTATVAPIPLHTRRGTNTYAIPEMDCIENNALCSSITSTDGFTINSVKDVEETSREVKQADTEDASIENIENEDDVNASCERTITFEAPEILPAVNPEAAPPFKISCDEVSSLEMDNDVVFVRSIDCLDTQYTTSRLSKSSQPTRVATFSARSRITYYMNATKSTSVYADDEKIRVKRKRRKRKGKPTGNTALDNWLRKADGLSSSRNDINDKSQSILTKKLLNSKFPRIVLSSINKPL